MVRRAGSTSYGTSSLNTPCATSTRLGLTRASASRFRYPVNGHQPRSPARSSRFPCSADCTTTTAPRRDDGRWAKEPGQPRFPLADDRSRGEHHADHEQRRVANVQQKSQPDVLPVPAAGPSDMASVKRFSAMCPYLRAKALLAVAPLLLVVSCGSSSDSSAPPGGHLDGGSNLDGASSLDGGSDAGPVPRPDDTTAAANRLACKYARGALPAATLGPGTPIDAQIPINHIVVVMMENHSFDSYLGHLN